MIKMFLSELPYKLSQPMFREYERKVIELKRWYDNSSSLKIKRYLNQQETLHYLFALGIYYRYIIAPLSSTEDFFQRLNSNFEGSLKLGGHKIDSNFQKSILAAHEHFESILKTFNIPESFFTETDVKKIVLALIEIEERHPNERD